MLFCHVTTRIKGHAHDDLLTEKGGNAFPTLMVLDSVGDSLAKHQGARDVSSLLKTVESSDVRSALAELAKVRAKAESGDLSARGQILTRRILAGSVSAQDARAAAKELDKLSGKSKKALDDAFVYLEYQEVLEQTKDMDDQAEVAGSKFLAMAKDKRVPDSKRARNFWSYVLRHTAKEGDLANFDKALKMYDAQLVEMYGKGSPNYRGLLKQAEALRESARRKR